MFRTSHEYFCKMSRNNSIFCRKMHVFLEYVVRSNLITYFDMLLLGTNFFLRLCQCNSVDYHVLHFTPQRERSNLRS